MNGEDDKLKFKNNDMDFLLKQEIVSWFSKALGYYSEDELFSFYKVLKNIRATIVSYEYSNKTEIEEYEKLLNEYFHTLKGKPARRMDAIKTRSKMELSLEYLLDEYLKHVMTAFTELGLWFFTKSNNFNFDLVLSDENFKDELDTTTDKRKELSQIPIDELLKLATPNTIHKLYAKHIVLKALNKGE